MRVRQVAGRLTSDQRVLGGLLAFLAAFVVYRLTAPSGAQVQNTYVWLADAFLHGRLDMPGAPTWLDWVEVNGRKFSHQGPLPGVLLMPFVAVWGLDFDLKVFSALLGGGISATAWSLAGRVGLRGWRRFGAWLFPVFGTTIWYEAKNGETWGIAALLSVLLLTTAVREYFGARRALLIGALVGLASLSRPGTILALAGFAFLLGPRRWPELGGGAAALFIFMPFYHYLRFGTLTDASFEVFYNRDPYRFQRPPGIFSLRHLPHNVYSWLFRVPGFSDEWPWLRLNLMGTGLPFTSPAFLAAFWAKRHRWLWLSALAVIVPAGAFYANGFAQFGMRYLLDAIPFLFALVCVALRDGWGGYPVLVAASVAVNAYGVWFTNAFGLRP